MPFSGLDLTGFFVPALNERESTVAFDINERGQIAGAPQVGFSAAMRKINSRTSFGVGLRPTGPRTPEIASNTCESRPGASTQQFRSDDDDRLLPLRPQPTDKSRVN